MGYRKIIYSAFGFSMIIAIVCIVVLYHMMYFQDTKIAFLDIGQGDAILISRGSQQILIDGGPDGTVLLEQLGKHVPFWDRNIEIVVATHPDSDHIDGLIGVFKNYSVDQFWHTNAGKETSVYRALMHYAKNENGVEEVVVFHGLSVSIDNDIRFDVVYPFEADVITIGDVNNASVTGVLYVGDEAFYLGGDLTSEIEDILPIGDEITVLKAGHHGSVSSTSENFLQKTKPRDVIISAGKNNRYGHPHKDVLDRASSINAQIFRTDENGTIIYNCDENGCDIVLNN